MKTTIGLAIVLTLGASCAFAQGGPGEKMQGPPGMRDQGPGAPGMREGGPGPNVEQKAEPRTEERGAEEHSKGEKVPRAAQQNERGKAAKNRAERADQPKRAETEQKTTAKPNGKADDRPENKAQSADDRKASERDSKPEAAKKDEDRKGEPAKQAEGGDRKEAAKHVALSDDKRDRVRTAIRERRELKHRTNVNIRLTIGARLPHDWDFVPIPVGVVDIVPEYGGYLFAYIDDDYVICDPTTYEIVAVIPASGAGGYASDERGGHCPSHISLSQEERDLIVDSVRRGNRVDVANITVGWSVPRNIELETFPDPVLSRASELGSCRYFVAEDQIAIVDPEEEKIVLLIDRN